MESERVTIAAGVPTIWMGVLEELDGRDVSSLRAIPCGGSAVPKSLSEAYREKIGLPILQAWGMTETSPLAALAHIKWGEKELAADANALERLFRLDASTSQPKSQDATDAVKRIKNRESKSSRVKHR